MAFKKLINYIQVKRILMLLFVLLPLVSCVSKKKFVKQNEDFMEFRQSTEEQMKELEDERNRLNQKIETADSDLINCRSQLQQELSKNKALKDEVDYLKDNNNALFDRLSDLSVISQAGAESIKQSLETLNEQQRYIKDLNSSVARKDSLNLALVMNLKRSLGDVNDQDVAVEVKKGVVYISLSDKMLFRSGSSAIQTQAAGVLSKIATVVNDHQNLDILVEGHTDNVPISNSCVTDNWDLSVKRSTAVVRMLQNRFNVDPSRMTAGGRSEFMPKSDNSSSQGRSLNRRTEIIILPKLDEFFKLMVPQQPK